MGASYLEFLKGLGGCKTPYDTGTPASLKVNQYSVNWDPVLQTGKTKKKTIYKPAWKMNPMWPKKNP